MQISLFTAADNTVGPQHMENILDAVHSRLVAGSEVVFGYHRSEEGIGLCSRFPVEMQATICGGLYPTSTVTSEPDHGDDVPADWHVVERHLHLAPDVFPLRRYCQFMDTDAKRTSAPVNGILQGLSGEAQCRVEIRVRRATAWRVDSAIAVLCRSHHRVFENFRWLKAWYIRGATDPRRRCRWPAVLARWLLAGWIRESEITGIDVSGDRDHVRESDKVAGSEKLTGHHLFAARLRIVAAVPPDSNRAGAEEAVETLTAALAPFVRQRNVSWHTVSPRSSRQRGFLLSTEELASIWHPPLAHVQTERRATTDFTQLEPPQELPAVGPPDVTLLGRICFRERAGLFGISQTDRMRHMHIIGKTGTGKTTLLEALINSDMRQGRGVAVFDPHGDMADRLIASVPKQRTEQAVMGESTPIQGAIFEATYAALRAYWDLGRGAG